MQPIILADNNYTSHSSDSYIFKSAQGISHWPKNQGYALARGGFWNFLWRTGFHPKQLTLEQLPNPTHSSVLFIDLTSHLNDRAIQKLQQWLAENGKIIATGEPDCWRPFLPTNYNWRTNYFFNPYAALAYILDDYQPQLIAPPNWSFIDYDGPSNNHLFIGTIAAVQGERQTPNRAHLQCYPKAPAVIQNGSFYYFNGHPFAALQAWLQGQEDLSPWLAWRHRLFWLDEWISFFCDIMQKLNILTESIPRPGIKKLNKTTIILRHDLDYSRDVAFLNEENKHKVDATYALLKDRNTNFWLDQLRPFPNHEIAFHYDTGKRNLTGLAKRLLTKKSIFSFLPGTRKIVRKGLLKQLKWAKQKGIDIQTIHRHLCYLIYPEWIDAMDTVFESNLNVLGSSSLFRGHVLRWGIDRVEGNHGFLGEWPDAQFPVWYPFKLVHASKNGKILKGWEMTALMDVEPEMLVKLLDHHIKHISQNIFTLIFHPAHANQATLYKQGSFNFFKSILNILAEREIAIMSMRKVLEKANKSMDVAQNDLP